MPLVRTVVAAVSGARSQDPADVRQEKGLAAGHEDFVDAEFGCLIGDSPHALEAERPTWRLGRGAHAAIVAMQVAIEIGVEPEAGSDRAIGGVSGRSLATSNHPARTAGCGRSVDQAVPREAAPGLEIGADLGLTADDSQELAPMTAAQRSDQLGQ